MRKMEFSICIPSFNRGQRALKLINSIIESGLNGFEVILLNNNSNIGNEYYDQIEKIAESNGQIRYIKHETNILFCGNFLKALKSAQTSVVLMISDEDIPNIEALKPLVQLIYENDDIGLIRGSIEPCEDSRQRNAIYYEDAAFSPGEDALVKYALTNNYFSGTIYNLKLLEKYDMIEKLSNAVPYQRYYPHLYLELMICVKAQCLTTSIVTCFEGKPEIAQDNNPVNYAPPYSYGSRVDQFIALRDGLMEVICSNNDEFDIDLFFKMYAKLFLKYLRLIGLVNAPLYINQSLYPDYLKDSFYKVVLSGIVVYPQIQPYFHVIVNQLEEIYEKNK